MLIVAGSIDVDPADRDRFLAGKVDQVRATLAERGCVEYAFSADAVDPGRVRLFECWENEADFAAHVEAMRSRAEESTPEVPVLARRFAQYAAEPRNGR